ncbi:myb-related transcription factor, partner of profilin-like [Rhinatrema bivittatum]|uniref:myb-related transcription factor, partner of profilin-like n=1 Tax=Rhinatrema bivittatum TaxID=194408 RepID=UPI0011281900|nr:myb-related transcription factor, partner of profilin-like [Rhinatrema bivittatum]
MCFSQEDNDRLIEGVLRHYAHLFGNLSVKTSKAAKAQLWASIAADIRRQSGIPCTGEQVAHRYQDIKAQLKVKIAERNEYLRETGGTAPCPICFTDMERRLMQWLGPDVFEELDPRLDTSHLEDEHFGPRQQMSDASWEGPGTSRDPLGTRRPPMFTMPFHMDAMTQWSDEEEEEELGPITAAEGSPLNLSAALVGLEWEGSPTAPHASSPLTLEISPPILPTPVMSPHSPAPAPVALIPNPPEPEAPPPAPQPATTAPPFLPPQDRITGTQVDQLRVELHGIRRSITQLTRHLQPHMATSTQTSTSMTAAIGTLNTIMLQILQQMLDQQSSSSTTFTPQASPSGSRGHRGCPPKKMPPPTGPAQHGKGL